MIRTATDYATVVEYLNRRDARRQPHRLPLERYSWSDCEYFFTLSARRCGLPFRNQELATSIIDALLWRKERHHWMLFCYCLMPDHLHILLQLPDSQSGNRNAGVRGVELASILHQIADFKSYTTTQLWWKVGGNDTLWQESSYDRVIRYNDSIDHAVSYILNNPVRNGIVEEWMAYPYAGVVDEW